jgi:hypothetical protein
MGHRLANHLIVSLWILRCLVCLLPNVEIKLINSDGRSDSGETCPRRRKSRIISKQPSHSPQYVCSEHLSNETNPLAGNARQGQIDEAKAAGMDDVIIKPYRLDDLLQKIENMMRIRNSQNTSAVETVETPDAIEIEMGE